MKNQSENSQYRQSFEICIFNNSLGALAAVAIRQETVVQIVVLKNKWVDRPSKLSRTKIYSKDKKGTKKEHNLIFLFIPEQNHHILCLRVNCDHLSSLIINKQFMEPESEVQICTLPPRPRGLYSKDRFRNVQISTNFYPVTTKEMEEIHIFKIQFTPHIMYDDRSTRNKVLEKALPMMKTYIRDPVISGMNIYSLQPPLQKQCTIETDGYKIYLKEVKILKVKENPKMLVQFLNNGLRNLMSRINYVEIGRTSKYFNINQKEKIQNLMMFSGYKANFMQLERGVFLRVDTAKKIVRNQTVLAAINQIYKLHSEKERDEKRAIVKSELIDKIIMTNYGKTRYFKISDLEFEDLDTVIIPEANLSIRQYFKKKYQIKIQQAKQPLLVVQNKKGKEQKTYMVPELCLMTGIPDDFDEFRRKKISQATIKSAEERKRQIQGLMDQIKNTNEIYSLNEIGIKIDKNMQTFQAKLIPPPRLALGNEERVEQGKQSFFNLFAQPIFASKHSIRCGLVYFKSTNSHQIIDLFEDTSKRLRVDLKVVKLNIGQFDSRRAVSAIDKYVQKAAEQEGCNICLIIIPNNIKTQYKRIKENCLVNNKIVCQIATEGTLRKKNFKSIATKILLQMVAKRGNTLWVPQSVQKIEKTMLMAFDSSKSGKKSVLSGVATLNSTFSSISSKIQEFTDTTDKLKGMFSLALKLVDAYVHRNKTPPEEIIAFSNSCAADQVRLYQEFFLEPLNEKLEGIYNNAKPKITFVLANTKTSERFFQQQGNNVRNVPAGTIVSENIVSKNYDFFMVSQFANKGSTVPNHYRVIFSDSKMEEGVLQQLIYSQCFNYVNWTGSIKVPGILQYAKKCARFNTQVIDVKNLSEELENKLYFI